MFDGNSAELFASPTGPGTGLNTIFAEDFENPAALAQWTDTVSPGSRTCGLWTDSTATTSRPAGSTGAYAISDGSTCGSPKTSTTFESPSIDVNLAGILSVSLEFDVYYKFLNGGDNASVQVWDGTAWQTVWAANNADVNSRLVFDVTAWASGNPDFRIRFDYQVIDQWLAVDNIAVVADILNVCATTTGPAPVPTGDGTTAPLLGNRMTVTGDQISLSWDATSCSTNDYNLVYGDLADVSSYTISGSECSLGATGAFDWSNVPAGSLFFLVVGTERGSVESSWGTDSLYGERNGETPSGQCGVLTKDLSGSCP